MERDRSKSLLQNTQQAKLPLNGHASKAVQSSVGAHARGQRLDFIGTLRRVSAWVPLAEALSMTGAAMAFGGASWGAVRFIREHPYFLFIFAGLSIFAAGLAASQHGIIMFLPVGLQDFLLRTTLFDLLHDNAASSNFMRRWGRLFMLCSFNSEEDVATITDGMDPEFVRVVFENSIIELFPAGLNRLLLPDPQTPLLPRSSDVSQCHAQGQDQILTSPVTPAEKWRNAVHAVNTARRLHAFSLRVQPESLTIENIRKGVQRRDADVNQRIVEPGLGPAVQPVVRTLKAVLLPLVKRLGFFLLAKLKSVLLNVVTPSRPFVLKALSAVSMCSATCWMGSWALLVRSRPAQDFVVSAFAFLAIGRGWSKEAIVRRSTRGASVLAMLSAGCSVVLFGSSRYHRYLEERQRREAGG